WWHEGYLLVPKLGRRAGLNFSTRVDDGCAGWIRTASDSGCIANLATRPFVRPEPSCRRKNRQRRIPQHLQGGLEVRDLYRCFNGYAEKTHWRDQCDGADGADQEHQGIYHFAKGSRNGYLGGFKNLVTSPVQTVSGAASGLGTALRRASDAMTGPKRSESEDSRVKDFIGFSKTKREYAYDLGVDV